MGEPVTLLRVAGTEHHGQGYWSCTGALDNPPTGEYRALPAKDFAALTARLERALDLLRHLGESGLRCPECGHSQCDDEQGRHHDGCRIDALLGEAGRA